MKKFTKIVLILAGVCIVLGMSLVIGAGMFGDMYYHNADVHVGLDGIKINDRNAGIYVGPDGVRINGIELDDLSEDMKKYLDEKTAHEGTDAFEGEAYEGTVAFEAETEEERLVLGDGNVRNVEIAVNAADLEIIRREDADGIVLEDVSEYLEFSHSLEENNSVEGKTLKLEVGRKDKYKTAGISGEASAVLVIPSDVRFQEFDIETNASALTAGSIEAEELELEVNASSLELADINVGDLSVNNNAGTVTIHGNVERELDVEVNAGDVEVQMIGIYQDFNYSLQTNAGSIEIADQEYSGLKEEKKIKNAAAKKVAELECNMGSIEVGFFNEV